jgi:hypothetical protein
MGKQLLQDLAPVIVTVLGAALTWVLGKVSALLTAKTAAVKAGTLADHGLRTAQVAAQIASEVVKKYETDIQDAIKDPVKMAALRTVLVQDAKDTLKSGFPTLVAAAGVGDGLDTFLQHLVDVGLAKASPPPPPGK